MTSHPIIKIIIASDFKRMVKKTQRYNQLGYVFNDDYIDEYLDILDPYPKLLPSEEA